MESAVPEQLVMEKPKHNRHVSFQAIHIREYQREIGDHPCVTSGPPISLGWNYSEEMKTFDLDEYESERRPKRRSEMRLGAKVRAEMLREFGVNENDILKATEDVSIVKARRNATKRSSRAREQMSEKFESASRKVLRRVTFQQKERQLNSLLGACAILQHAQKRLYLHSFSCMVLRQV